MECVAPPIYLKRFLSRRLAKLMKIRKLFLRLRSCVWVFIISIGIFFILKEFLEKVGSTWFFNKLVYKKIEVEVISNRYLFSGMGGGITWSNWFMHQWIEICRHGGIRSYLASPSTSLAMAIIAKLVWSKFDPLVM